MTDVAPEMSYIEIYWKKILGRAVLIAAIYTQCLQSQNENNQQLFEGVRGLLAEAFLYESDSSGKGRIDTYIQVPYSEIKFVKEEDLYIGQYDVSLTVLTQEKQQVWQKSHSVELRLKEFPKTVSNRLSNIKQFSVDLLPGKYELLLQMTDKESKKVSVLQKSVTVKDFVPDSLMLSDLMLVYRVNINESRKEIVPNLSGVLTKKPDEFYLFFEIYNRPRLDSVQMMCKIINSKKEISVQRVKSQILIDDRTQVVWHIDTPSLAADRYVIFVEVVEYPKVDLQAQLRASVSRTCIVRMMNLPLSITDIDKATVQLQYIAKGIEIDYIEEAPDPEEKLKRFLEFWAKRDPDPKTPRNELMEEYYSRVEYANKNFPSYMEGWKTDRGMVLIRFGLPQNIDRHPFNAENKPYEIWYYYDLNREFVFIDETGFGDYRLRYPTTDLWGRIR